jgi:hypothetical protein
VVNPHICSLLSYAVLDSSVARPSNPDLVGTVGTAVELACVHLAVEANFAVKKCVRELVRTGIMA